MLVEAVISVDAYPFMAFSDMTYHPQDTGIGVFANKNTVIDLVPCRTWKHVPTAIFSGVDISEVPGCYLLQQMISQ